MRDEGVAVRTLRGETTKAFALVDALDANQRLSVA
jgi:hypothetical protein